MGLNVDISTRTAIAEVRNVGIQFSKQIHPHPHSLKLLQRRDKPQRNKNRRRLTGCGVTAGREFSVLLVLWHTGCKLYIQSL